MTICSVCGKGELKLEVRDYVHTYKNDQQVFANLKALYCSACAEPVFDAQTSAVYAQHVNAHAVRVNERFVDAQYITTVRRALNLTKLEAGKLFGGGKNAFNRYESGEAAPSIALKLLFRVLEKNPELLETFRETSLNPVAAINVKSNQNSTV